MTSLRTTALMLAALALAGCATKAPAPDSRATAAAYFAQDYSCAPDAGTKVELAALLRAPASYAGQCVRVLGFAKANALYHDAEHAAEPGLPKIGLDWNDAAMARRLAVGPSFVALTGRLRLCRRRQAMAALAAPAHPETGCRGATAALLVSAARIVPTAMD